MKKWEDEIQKKTQSLWENHKVALLISILAIPLIIQIVFGVFNLISETESWNFKFPDSSNWIGFWGSYLGFIPSGLIAFLVAKQQIDLENRSNDLRRAKNIKLTNLNSVYDVLIELAEWTNTLGLINLAARTATQRGKHLNRKVILNLYKQGIENEKYKNNLPYVLKNHAKRFSMDNEIRKGLVDFSENYLSISIDMQTIELSLHDEPLISFDDNEVKLLIETTESTEKQYAYLVDSILNEINKISNI
ncbi:hypothetical protein [Leuconostoc mesenteroides]|uniref:hypothetical protein n=1 Tax=Leuconostoc mesenteroides TaxID=1245 RepID=UPI000682F731|nr:hypothetical protein [Leuconostoc mesenteroides]KMY78653.1 hypothetical protein WZ79_02635 [Leuconostoc mesenteroides subsp. mesenteroides]